MEGTTDQHATRCSPVGPREFGEDGSALRHPTPRGLPTSVVSGVGYPARRCWRRSAQAWKPRVPTISLALSTGHVSMIGGSATGSAARGSGAETRVKRHQVAGESPSPDPGPNTSSADRPDEVRGTIRSLPPFVWVASATMLAVLLLGTVLLPQLLIPDEKHHADMVLFAQEGSWLQDGWPAIGERRLDPAIVEASLSLGPAERELRENRALQHPPLFYVTAAGVSSLITLPLEDPALAVKIWTYRLVAALASALLPIAFYLVAAELTSNRWIRLSSAVFPLAIPGVTLRNGAMVNPDALLMLLTSLGVLFAVRVAKGDRGWKTAVGLGLSTGLAAITKGHALLVIPVIMVAYGVQLARSRPLTREKFTSVVVAGGVSLVVGGWWWVRNLVLYRAVQPLGNVDGTADPRGLDWSSWLAGATERAVAGLWGAQFALGGRSYMSFFWVLTAVVAIACAVGWVRSSDRVDSSVAALYALLLFPAIFMTSALVYAKTGDVRGIQGRYLYPGFAGIAPLLGFALVGRGNPRRGRWLPVAYVMAAATITVLSIRFMLDRHWSEHGPAFADRWSAVVDSSPLPEVIPLALLVLTGVGFLALFVSAVSMARSKDTGPAATTDTGAPGSAPRH